VRDAVEGLPGTPVFVAYAVDFDFTFVYRYLVEQRELSCNVLRESRLPRGAR